MGRASGVGEGDDEQRPWIEPDSIFFAARVGDLTRARFLVEVDGVDVTQYDRWQATPLYYAALCGNVEMVRYLLTAGASCEEKTFDGERCLYAALNDETKRVLLEEGFRYAQARSHDAYLDFVENLFDNDDEATLKDIVFHVRGESVAAHRAVLAARCPYLASRWGFHSGPVDLEQSRISADVFRSLMRWMYTERFEVSRGQAALAAKLCRQCGLLELASQLQEAAVAREVGVAAERVVIEPASDEAKRRLQTCFGTLLQSVHAGAGGDGDDGAGGGGHARAEGRSSDWSGLGEGAAHAVTGERATGHPGWASACTTAAAVRVTRRFVFRSRHLAPALRAANRRALPPPHTHRVPACVSEPRCLIEHPLCVSLRMCARGWQSVHATCIPLR